MSGVEQNQEDNLVKACPICGAPVLHSCHHEGTDVRSIEMPISKAIDLMDDWIEGLQDTVDQAKESRQQLVACMMDWET